MDHSYESWRVYVLSLTIYIPVVLDINDPRILIIHSPLPSLLLPVLTELLCETQKSSVKKKDLIKSKKVDDMYVYTSFSLFDCAGSFFCWEATSVLYFNSFSQHQKINESKITSEETRKIETQLSRKKKTRTNKQSWLSKERKRERETLPAEVGTSAWNSSVLLFILNHFLTIFMDQASFISQNPKEF